MQTQNQDKCVTNVFGTQNTLSRHTGLQNTPTMRYFKGSQKHHFGLHFLHECFARALFRSSFVHHLNTACRRQLRPTIDDDSSRSRRTVRISASAVPTLFLTDLAHTARPRGLPPASWHRFPQKPRVSSTFPSSAFRADEGHRRVALGDQ